MDLKTAAWITAPLGRPQIDPEIKHFEGFTDEEVAMVLETQSALLERRGMYGVAADLRGAAERIREIAEGK